MHHIVFMHGEPKMTMPNIYSAMLTRKWSGFANDTKLLKQCMQISYHCQIAFKFHPYRSIIYASFSKRTPMTIYVSNKQVSSRQAYIYTLIYIGDQGIVYLFVGHVNRHWGAFVMHLLANAPQWRFTCPTNRYRLGKRIYTRWYI